MKYCTQLFHMIILIMLLESLVYSPSLFSLSSSSEVDVISAVSVCLLRTPHRVHVLVVVSPVVVGAGPGPVVRVRQTVSVSTPVS